MTAEKVYSLIKNNAISKEVAIKLIENYGLRHERTAIEKLQQEICLPFSEEMKIILKRIESKLNEVLEKTVGSL